MDVSEPLPSVDVVMSDGRSATIREAASQDRDELVALHDNIDDDTLRLRFFNVSRTAGRHYVDHVLAADRAAVISMVAEVDGVIVALGTAERIAPAAAEVAFLVADDERGHGLGTLLLEHLARACAQVDIRTFTADVLPENTKMAQVFQDAGYRSSRHVSSGVMQYELSTEESPTVVDASRRRLALAREVRSSLER